MIIEVTAYRVQCDRCEEIYGDDDFEPGPSLFSDREDARQFADQDNWEFEDDRVLCPKCQREERD